MIFGWQYPPGVTGNEPQIAGCTHYRECPQHEDNESDEAVDCLCYEIAWGEAAAAGNRASTAADGD